MTSRERIRNFCIIAHVDHGKSTLADRFLEITGTVPAREMRPQFLDQLEIERERGITIKLAPVRMEYTYHATRYVLNLIDTPGHADFTYEVSRSLACVEGAVLLVDASQGVQAQTIANLYLALEQNLTIVPVVNKIDLPAVDLEKVVGELSLLLGVARQEIVLVSAKEGTNVSTVLERVIEKVPAPSSSGVPQLQALIFDSTFDTYKGVVASVRIVGGKLVVGDRIRLAHGNSESEVLEVGVFRPKLIPQDALTTGEIGYVVTGFKESRDIAVGDTIIEAAKNTPPLPGYRRVQSMVFAGVYPKDGDEFPKLRASLEKLKLSDASLEIEPESSPALGFGFRVGFLGLLHVEVTRERLLREYGMEVIPTVPSVGYRVYTKNGTVRRIRSALEFPDPSSLERVEEPWVRVDVVTPQAYVGSIMELCASRRGIYLTTEYLGGGKDERAILHYELPLASILVDFYDTLQGASQGYASLAYEFSRYRSCDVVRLDIRVQEEDVPSLASLVIREEAQRAGRKIVETMANSIPRQMFTIKIQAVMGGRVIAAERISPLRKDVTKKLSGGDVTRKRKLLEKQKKGKKKLASLGAVEIPPETYLAVLKR